MHEDEFLIEQADFINGTLPKRSKVIFGKTFVICKQVIRFASIAGQEFEVFTVLTSTHDPFIPRGCAGVGR